MTRSGITVPPKLWCRPGNSYYSCLSNISHKLQPPAVLKSDPMCLSRGNQANSDSMESWTDNLLALVLSWGMFAKPRATRTSHMFFDEPASILSLEVNNQSCCLLHWRFAFFLHDSISRRNCLDVCFCVMTHTRRFTDDNGSGIVFRSQREDNLFLNDLKMCCRRCLLKCWLTFPSDGLPQGNPLRRVPIGAKPHWLSDATAGIWRLISF